MKPAIILRTPSGVSGDMLVAGLARLASAGPELLEEKVRAIGLEELFGCLAVEEVCVNGISGFQAKVRLKPSHDHRSLADIREILFNSRLTPRAMRWSLRTFEMLAEAEARVHGVLAEDVTFHEIGALDSLVDICVASALVDHLDPEAVICSPLPICDGLIRCAHGTLNAPAPAVQHLLEGLPVYGIPSEGETVTPTAVALLKALGACFGNWPAVKVRVMARVYGGRMLPGIQNGALFALGDGFEKKNCEILAPL